MTLSPKLACDNDHYLLASPGEKSRDVSLTCRGSLWFLYHQLVGWQRGGAGPDLRDVAELR